MSVLFDPSVNEAAEPPACVLEKGGGNIHPSMGRRTLLKNRPAAFVVSFSGNMAKILIKCSARRVKAEGNPDYSLLLKAIIPAEGLFSTVFVLSGQLVLKTVRKGVPAGFNDILGYTDGAPDVVFVPGFDKDADPGSCSGPAVNDPDLEIHQPHVIHIREEIVQGFSQGIVQGADRAASFGRRDSLFAVNRYFYGCMGGSRAGFCLFRWLPGTIPDRTKA